MRDYTGKKVFIGIDVHKKSYSVAAIFENELVKKAKIYAQPEGLVKFCQKYFPGANIISAYEAGFCGFYLHRYLISSGIKNIVVHPASIEIASRERVKTDKRDALKIAMQLSGNRLRGIHVPEETRELYRSLTRLRETFVRQRNRLGVQLKAYLFTRNRIEAEDDTKVSKNWIGSLLHEDYKEEEGYVVREFCEEWLRVNTKIKEIDKKLADQAFKDSKLHGIYVSVPGIGFTSARILSNELGDMSQFPNRDKLYSYTGLTPREYSSGENKRLGSISRQGKPILRKILVQAAWRAIREEMDLCDAFVKLGNKVGKKRAIVAIARRLVGRIKACLQRSCPYKLSEDKEGSLVA